MQESGAIAQAFGRFYDSFSTADTEIFAAAIADCPGVSVIGTGPGEGHDERGAWISTYDAQIREMGLKLEGGGSPRGYEEGDVGWGVDEPAFVLPDGSRLQTRLTGVFHREDGEWKVVHLHFSVGVPDEEALELAG